MDALYSSVSGGGKCKLAAPSMNKEDKLRSAAPLGPFSVLVIASRGKMVEYCFLSLARTPARCTKSVRLQTAFRRVLFALKHSARRRLSAQEIDWYFRFEEKSAGK